MWCHCHCVVFGLFDGFSLKNADWRMWSIWTGWTRSLCLQICLAIQARKYVNAVTRTCTRVLHCHWYFSISISSSGNRSSKTFKPKKNIPEGSHQYELLKHAEATLGSGNLRMAVMLPDGEDLNEWIAVNSKNWDWCHINLFSLCVQ